jgi:hypothetical protein
MEIYVRYKVSLWSTQSLSIKKNGWREDNLYLSRFYDEVAADPRTLFGLLKPLLEAHGIVLSSYAPGDIFRALLQAVLVQLDAHQLLLNPSEQGKVRPCLVWQRGWVLKHLESFHCHPLLHTGG